MTDPEDSGRSGWTILKGLGLVLASLAMVGFGAGGMCGVAWGLMMFASDSMFLWLGLLALALAVGCLLIVISILRSTDRESS